MNGRAAVADGFFRGVAETMGTRILMIGIGLVTSVIVARILGPAGRGFYAVAVSIGAMGVQFGNLGLHASNTYHVSKDRSLLPALLGNALVVSVGVGGLIAVAACAVFLQWPRLAPLHGTLLLLALAYIPFGLGYMLLQNLLLGVQKIRAYNTFELLNRILAVSLVGIVIIFGAVTVETVFTMSLIALVVCLVLMLRLLRTILPGTPAPSFSVFKENLRYGLKAYFTDFFAFLALRMNLLIVQYMVGAEGAGYYSIAVSMTDMIYMFPVVVGTILFPRVAALPRDDEKWKLTWKMARTMAWQMAAICAAAALAAKPLVLLLYGKVFAPSIPLFHLSLVAVFFLSIQGILVKYMAASGYPATIMWIWLVILTVSLALNVLLIRATGLPGAMYAAIVSNFLLLLLIAVFSIRHRHAAQPA